MEVSVYVAVGLLLLVQIVFCLVVNDFVNDYISNGIKCLGMSLNVIYKRD